jgi:hypothetical protein
MSAVVKAVEKVVDTVVKTVEAVIKDPLPTLLTIAGTAVGIPPYVTQAAISAARGGDLEDIAKSAAIAYVAPSVAAKIAPAVGSAVGSVVTNEAAAKALTAATSQSLVAGSLTAATGGDWQQAAAGSFAGSMTAAGYDKYVAPEVMAQAKSLGLSAESHASIQGALKAGTSSGVAAAATGGDFTTGFANAFVESGWDDLTAKAKEGLQDVKNTFLKDTDVKDNPPTFAGVSDTLVEEVPISADGKIAQDNSVSIEEQLAEINKTPRSAEYGRQYGEALAASEYSDIPGYKPAQKYGYETITQDVPDDVAGVLKPIEVVGKALTDDDLKRSALTGDFGTLKDITQIGDIAPMGGEPEMASPEFDSKMFKRLLSQADQSSTAAIEAQVQATISPTPENIAAAEQAQLAAELDQKVLADAEKQTSSEGAPAASEAPAQTTAAAPTIDQTNKSILNAITSGNATTGVPTPVQGSVVVDASGLSPLQQAGMADVQGAGGISDPIDGQTGKVGTLTGKIPMPQTMQPQSGGPMPRPGAPMPQGGLQFSNFARTGSAPQQGNLVGSLIPNLLSELNNQSLMMMSPEEYALRTQAGNIFRIARGGLVTLKKQR